MLTASQFRPERSPLVAGTTGNWFFAFPDDPEVIVRGDDSGPSQPDIDRANFTLSNLEALKLRAISLLEEFMRDKGTWYLATVDCGSKAQRLESDYVLSFSFTADAAPHEYNYTYFDVCFRVAERAHSTERAGRPIKFVVGFH
jgi:hypothetical protein